MKNIYCPLHEVSSHATDLKSRKQETEESREYCTCFNTSWIMDGARAESILGRWWDG